MMNKGTPFALHPLAYEALAIEGNPRYRALKNYDRLETENYDAEHVFQDGKYKWPGDWEGRTMLGITLLAQATGREPKFLQTIMSRLPRHLNEQGYFGSVLPKGTVDEQQLAGNSWFLRAMVEYHLWKKDEASLGIIHSIVRNLLLPSRGSYHTYPALPEERVYQGEAIGSIERKVNNWYVSSDTGCAFIMLDGASHAYELLGLQDLKELLGEMIDKFLSIDILGLSFQTHATLSALRGLLRYYGMTFDERVLERAEQIFAIYCHEGMTENFANYNWFGRPEWTEPCAIVDSFIAAVELWRYTGKVGYLETAHHIYYNGLGYGQRPNGGFGCDTCVGAHDVWLSPKSLKLFEASWCCTMRGGEGLAQAIRFAYFQQGQEVFVPFYFPGSANIECPSGRVALTQQTGYPFAGQVQLTVRESTLSSPLTLRLYVPSEASSERVQLKVDGIEQAVRIENGFAFVSGAFSAGTVIELSFPIELKEVGTINRNSLPGLRGFRHGPLLLGVEHADEALPIPAGRAPDYLGEGCYTLSGTDAVFKPVLDMIDKSQSDAETNRKQVLFGYV